MDDNLGETTKMIDLLEERVKACQQAIYGTRDIENVIERNLVVEILQLQIQVDKLFKSPFAEFEKKCSAIQSWLDNPSVTSSSLSQSSLAKISYILQHREFLIKMTDDFKKIETLLPYISFPLLEDIPNLKQKLNEIENVGFFLGEEIQTMKENIMSLALKHNTTMNMLAGLFKEWGDLLCTVEQEN